MKKTIIIILLVVAALLMAAAVVSAVWNLNYYRVTVTPAGDSDMVLEVGEAFRDPGASARVAGTLLHRFPQQLQVLSSGTVDSQKLGSYTIVYSASSTHTHFLGNKQAQGSAVRKVRVVDTQPPEIQLLTRDGSFTLPGHPYEEEGFTATDNYDGDVTAQVTREEKDGKVYYSVKDSSGNVATAVRQIYYDDLLPPELTLTGGQSVDVVLGESYVEPGFTAVDNYDGDVTAKVQVSGTVNTKSLGNYFLTYTVSDAYGNSTAVTRKVKVIRDMPTVPKGVGGVIYLTFDDGPGKYTQQLLDILDEYGVKATFFVVGYKDLAITKEMVARGHSVGNHSYSHDYPQLYDSKASFFEELYRTEALIEAACGVKPKLIRFPGGSSNSVSGISMRYLTAAVEREGYVYFDWNVSSKDTSTASTPEEVYRNVCNGCSKRSVCVVLQHDVKGYSVEAVEYIIRWGLANGYTFEALTVDSPAMHHWE